MIKPIDVLLMEMEGDTLCTDKSFIIIHKKNKEKNSMACFCKKKKNH